MPYPNEHACRLRDPSDFQKGSFRSKESKIDNKPVRQILGRLKKDGKMTLQAIRFPTAHWTQSQAKAKCSGTFEPAKK